MYWPLQPSQDTQESFASSTELHSAFVQSLHYTGTNLLIQVCTESHCSEPSSCHPWAGFMEALNSWKSVQQSEHTKESAAITSSQRFFDWCALGFSHSPFFLKTVMMARLNSPQHLYICIHPSMCIHIGIYFLFFSQQRNKRKMRVPPTGILKTLSSNLEKC